MASKRVEEICYWLRPKSAALALSKQVLPLHSFARFVPANSQRLAAGTCGTAPSTMKLQASKAPAPIGKKNSTAHHVTREPPHNELHPKS